MLILNNFNHQEKYYDCRFPIGNWDYPWVDQNVSEGPHLHSQQQTSRSTPRWNEGIKANWSNFNEYNSADLRNYLIHNLDIDVYGAFRTPGFHVVPKDLINSNYLVVPEYLWDRTKTTKFLPSGECIKQSQWRPVTKDTFQIKILKNSCQSMFRENEIIIECSHPDQQLYQRFIDYPDRIPELFNEHDEYVLSYEALSDDLKEMFPVDSAKVEAIIFNYGSKYLGGLYSNDLEELWLCRGDLHLDNFKFDGLSLTCDVSFYYVTIPYPSAAVMSHWKRREALQRRARGRLEGQRNVRQVRGWSFTKEERKAMMTLRDLVSERQYRRYLTNGFIMVQGESGLYYQIFNDQRNIKVWKDNEVQYQICIHTDRNCPPTDHVINCKMMIDFDEKEVWRGGNVSGSIQMHHSDQLIEQNWHLIAGYEYGNISQG